MNGLPLRVLCLHGYQGSAAIMRGQLRPLADGLAVPAEFVTVDAPSLAAGDFGWWHGDSGYRGWDRTREWLVDTFERQGPFDGVLGFSQGAALTALVPGLSAVEPVVAPRFVIIVSGFRSLAPAHAELFAHRDAYRLPSLHIIGDNDMVVAPADSRALATLFPGARTVRHPGGHVIAATPEVRAAFADFLADAGIADPH